MAKLPHNIERLPGKAHYTGYGSGLVWRIVKSGSGWKATATSTGRIEFEPRLAELSVAINRVNPT